jgi:ammonium transporter, Amt family
VTEDQEIMGLDLSQHGESALGTDLLGGAYANGNGHGNGTVKHREQPASI